MSALLASRDHRRALAIASKCCIDASKFNWYDSKFLRRFEAAKRFLNIVAPERVEDFVAAFDVLRTDRNFHSQIVDPVFDDQTFRLICETVRSLPYASLEHYESDAFGRAILRGHPLFTELQASLTANVSRLVGEPVTPAYNFLSLYRSTGKCDPHLDQPFSKWTLDICIEQSVGWPIYLSQVVAWPSDGGSTATIEDLRSDPSLTFDSIVLSPNTGVIFSGSSQWHFREPMVGSKSEFCHLLFLHYLPEGAEALAQPKRWAEHFNMPELDILMAADALVIARKGPLTETEIVSAKPDPTSQ